MQIAPILKSYQEFIDPTYISEIYSKIIIELKQFHFATLNESCSIYHIEWRD